MLYSIEEREDLENLNELNSLNNQEKAVRLQDRLGKQNFPEDMKKYSNQLLKQFKKTSEDLTKTMMLTSEENNKH